MTMRNVFYILLACLLALYISFTFVFAWRHYTMSQKVGMSECPLTEEFVHFFYQLGLSKEQLAQIEPMAHDFHMTIDALSKRILEERNMIIMEIKKDDPNLEAIDLHHQAISEAQAHIQKLVVQHFLEMKAIMNSDQKKMFLAAMENNFGIQRFTMPHK